MPGSKEPLGPLISTTTRSAGPAERARAEAVAHRCGLRYVPRRDSVARLIRGAGAKGAYVVGPKRAELRARGLKLAVHPSVLHLVRHRGLDHPFLRALAPEGRAERVIDATLGLAKDALHAASLLGCRVTGIERSPLLACLCEDGLARLEPPWSEGGRRIEVVEADSAAWLEAQDPQSACAVVLDPMFEQPRAAAAGFDLLRALAWPEPLGPRLLDAALRVGRRVVVKVPRAAPPPPGAAWEQVRGRDLDYWVATPLTTKD